MQVAKSADKSWLDEAQEAWEKARQEELLAAEAAEAGERVMLLADAGASAGIGMTLADAGVAGVGAAGAGAGTVTSFMLAQIAGLFVAVILVWFLEAKTAAPKKKKAKNTLPQPFLSRNFKDFNLLLIVNLLEI